MCSLYTEKKVCSEYNKTTSLKDRMHKKKCYTCYTYINNKLKFEIRFVSSSVKYYLKLQRDFFLYSLCKVKLY